MCLPTVFFDRLTTSEAAQVTVLGCTNRPFDIDEAILRRMPRSFLFDLPDVDQRVDILNVLLRDWAAVDPACDLDEPPCGALRRLARDVLVPGTSEPAALGDLPGALPRTSAAAAMALN